MTQQNRLHIVDQFRGIAVILMAIFHFCYNLSVYNFLTFEMNGGFFTWFRFVIVTLFFTSIGAGLFMAHTPYVHWKKFGIRQLKIGLGALFISVSTLILYPRAWVWFGVLHFIFIASILALPFIRIPLISLITGLLIFVLYNVTDWFNLHFLWLALNDPFNLPKGTQDLTRLIPWLGMVLIGVYLGKVRFWNVKELPLGPLTQPINFISKHALIIYLVHQAPLFGLAWLLDFLLH